MNKIEMALFISKSEVERFPDNLSDYSLNGLTKLSPIVWKKESEWISIFVDSEMTEPNIHSCKSRYKIGLLTESVKINPLGAYAALKTTALLHLVLTHDEELLAMGPPFFPYIPGGTLLHPQDSLHSCSKNLSVSISASSKNLTKGHRLRHQIIAQLAADFKIVVLGNGYQPYLRTSEPYEKFMFSVVVENEKSKFNLTEKLLEPLLNRCIPIYWGAKIQRDLFDQNGIIEFETLDELKDILKSINESDYKSRASAIEKNFVLSQTLISKEMNIIAAIQNSRLIPNFVCPDYFPTVIPENPIESHRTVTHNPARNDINKFVCLKVALEKFLYFSVKLVLIKKRITW